jgi:acetyl esterase/lipase
MVEARWFSRFTQFGGDLWQRVASHDLVSHLGSQLEARVHRAPHDLIKAVVSNRNFTLYRDLEYGILPRQKLDLYRAPNAVGTVVFVHGGYWDTGDKNEYTFLAETLCLSGFNAVLVNYRLAPEGAFPRMVGDVALALQWLTRALPLFGVDPNKIGLLGHSAGAHIAALLMASPEHMERVGLTRQAIRAGVLVAGPYDFLDWIETDPRTQKAMGHRDQWPLAQPAQMADGLNPPILLMHGVKDTLCHPENANLFAKAITNKGGHVESHMFDELDHFRIIGVFSKIARWLEPRVVDDTVHFLRRWIAEEQPVQ